jgi:hypothetical protein
VDATWQALLRADLIEVGRRKPLVGMLGALRMLPELAAQILAFGTRRGVYGAHR